jgi:type I restriction enzyme S subunit
MKEGWQTKTLGDLCRIQTGKKDVNEGNPEGVFPFFTCAAEHTFSDSYSFDTEALLIAGNGDVGKVSYYNGKFEAYQRTYVLSAFTEVSPRFLYLILDGKLKDTVSKQKLGNTMPYIKVGMLRDFQLPVPPLPEQKRIVGILDEAFEGIATAKANAEKNLKNARALFESHLQYVFTKRGNGWVETTLGDVCEFVGGSQPPKSVFQKTKAADNIRLIQIRDYKSDKHVVYIPRSQARRFCSADDVMIGRYGPPLFQILRGLDGAYNVALMKAVADESKLSRDFLFYFLKHSTILQYIIYHSERAAGQIGLTKETLQPYPIGLPPLAEQQRIVAVITELESEIKRLATVYERKLAALEALKKSFLHQAFSGQLKTAA